MNAQSTAERRFLAQKLATVRLHKRDDEQPAEGEEPKSPLITGYAAVFYREGDPTTEYTIWENFVERIMPGAFDRALAEDDVRALFNHDPNQVLGRSTAGTMRLSVDEIGLRYEIDPGDTETDRFVLDKIKRRDVTGSSFSFDFNPGEVVWREVDSLTIREVVSCRLWDVGPVTFPAYPGTTSEARAVNPEEARKAFDTYRRTQSDERQRELDRINAQARCVELGL